MALSVSEKLRIRENYTLLFLHPPPGYEKALQNLPRGVTITEKGSHCDQLYWFVQNQAQLEKEMSRVMKLLKPGTTVWVCYPKGSSKIQTDLTRDKGWDCLLAEGDKLTWLTLVSFDDTWSAFGFRAKTEADKKKEAKPAQEREIFKWADSATKKVKLPPELAAAFKKHKKAAACFAALAFSHKREYIEWIVTAKREETRSARIKGTIERLEKGWKNPRNI